MSPGPVLPPSPRGRGVLLVDAGYLYAAAGDLLLGTPRRREFRVDAPALLAALTGLAAEALPVPMLRVYWYDAARDRVPTVEQRAVARLAHVKVRLGNLNAGGVQKGVDALLRSDLEALARHGAVSDALLLGGDEDLLPAVEAAQAYGVRVHLWGVEPRFGVNQSERLVWEADTVASLGADLLRPHVVAVERPAAAAPAVAGLGTGVGAGSGTGLDPGLDAGLVAGAGAGAGAAGTGSGVEAAAAAPPGTPVGDLPAQGGHPLDGAVPAAAAPDGAVAPAPRAGAPLPSEVFGHRHPPAPPAALAGPPAAPAASRPDLGPDPADVRLVGEHVAHTWLVTRGKDNLADLLPGPLLPSVIDHELLVAAESQLGRSLRPWDDARRALRDGFWERLYREFGIGIGTSR